MINIVSLVKQNVDQWNTDQRCGYCWEFTAPMLQSDLNEYQFRGDGCCVLVAITDFRLGCITDFNRTTGLQALTSETYDFNLHVLVQGDIGLNTYDEIDGHPIEESKWKKHLEPLMECFGCNPMQFCEYIGVQLEVVRWQMTPKINWLDMNYDGWTIQVQLRNNNVA